VENCGNRGDRETGTRSGTRAHCSAVAEARRMLPSGNLRACSACAGDYEDPDRTAWPADGEQSGAAECDAEDEFREEAS
jgi:hypothetical protein